MGIVQIIVVIAILLLLVKPAGTYLYHVFSNEPNRTDRIFGRVERGIYALSGLKKTPGMSWKTYALSFLTTNVVLVAFGYLILRLQSAMPLNPNGIAGMEQSLTFNTVISFITNTNLQHYSGETGLSYFSQMAVITMLMFTSAASGFSVAVAFVRGITGRATLGNFFEDFVKAHVRVFLPLALLVTLVLVSLQVPQTFHPTLQVTTIEGQFQQIAIGPVASLESIKHLGTNGGGFFGANSAHPFENPSPLTNVIEILSMWVLPAALPYMYGLFAKNKRQGWGIFAAMMTLFVLLLSLNYYAESSGNPAVNALGVDASQGSMEGKEVRFGIPQSALFTTVTTAATTGSVNNMHDTQTPLGSITPLALMMLNNVFGGKGVGLINMLMYAILAVFLCGLMVGRTPEFLGRKIEAREMKLIAVAILIHPLIILVPTAASFLTELGHGAISNPGYHGMTQMLYEYVSSAANNGSGFEGLADNSTFWNVMTGAVMLLGRYVSIIALLAVAGSLLRKQPVPETIGTFRTDNSLFTGILIATVLIIGALTFLPVIVLGPVAEYLTLR
ncbi:MULTISPECIES: potassium-transporting ATPase subunit KdpA [unclassified Paenibacillus]|uniref:potassium-transporting ATPase subunit KdpA n=1 Tax=unclassified Paenibacillus TaxID=185978 RepID=UPI002406FEE9|nr:MULTISPECIES: potassium-transporting ATPase subunit KdpA [unclassified Paenibacillus]MDF9839290.1 K+-transporting ATPase ATPase A chain [Paenibacillus sp. PastF-2]MDF9845871.1 K+-transporting ATPase ATPase A chain [Paenibacillus sp. PastM-2]MDF9852444.1 K+-transporting ATPase ATPase A chain [Paenibacillus sp. PastF-1]MDH6477826.1 K+-transporting ATPase ATPase A chain [Paenibacillus sp. PastH-2]MDH6505565.1 K+-transporting ATPase ATPase A chain [Paenibacillus sp. PastM-3]